jgi:hypothetical protein
MPPFLHRTAHQPSRVRAPVLQRPQLRQLRFDELRVIRPTKELQYHFRVHSCHRADVLQTASTLWSFLIQLAFVRRKSVLDMMTTVKSISKVRAFLRSEVSSLFAGLAFVLGLISKHFRKVASEYRRSYFTLSVIQGSLSSMSYP